ncbi:Cell surface protein [Acidisarcina polymorpha]|uniref:Cell surface protein n=1 Tax=Acidisarcina polymorpha TaxID=2211140 RepID=A0A2Z5FVR5_9BACT|nr:SBBP repeat-containing protein [Acidisarcina polymorpha]AXC10958.1 Cell surface protein [Acidisarcina polymorpha]
MYSTFLGNGGLEGASPFGPLALAVDGYGDAYLAGEFNGEEPFPVTSGAFQTTTTDGTGFVSKFSPTGRSLIYSTFLGGNPSDFNSAVDGIAVDPEGHLYATGSTAATNFPVTSDAYQKSNGAVPGRYNAFFTELNLDGSALEYSTYLGGAGGQYGDFGSSIAVDKSGNAFVFGEVSSPNFPVTKGAYRTTNIASGTELSDSLPLSSPQS